MDEVMPETPTASMGATLFPNNRALRTRYQVISPLSSYWLLG